MGRSLRSSFLIVLLGVWAGPGAAQNQEHRGLWVGFGAINTPEAVAEVVNKAVAAHLNVLYPCVWYNGGQAMYRSQICPLADDVDPQFDPLGELIRFAHQRGLQVHAWFVNGSYGYKQRGLFDQHPEWALQPGRPITPRWYDFGKPEVRRFQTEVMLECLRHYDLDGLHFDYIRYNGQDYCYCAHCQQEFAQRSGLPPLHEGAKTFPTVIAAAGNPLGRATTAQVLAAFEDGVPAITLNKLGQGEAALLNWQAQNGASPAVNEALRRLLQRFGATESNVFQLRTKQTAARYGLEAQQEAWGWLAGLGLRPQVIDETQLEKVPAGGVVFLYGQYYIPEETCVWLKEFVRAGGHALFVDGPVFAISSPTLQEVLGMQGTASYFSGRLRLLHPTPGQEVLPVGPPGDLELEKRRYAEWLKYRQWTVTELVRGVYREAKKAKPQARISAAVFPSRQAADAVCQDWYRWLQEGIIDYVIPMAYTLNNAELEKLLQEYKQFDPTLARIIPGLSLYQREGNQIKSRAPELVLSQVALCRSYGARGVNFFESKSLNETLIAALIKEPFAEPIQPYFPTVQP